MKKGDNIRIFQRTKIHEGQFFSSFPFFPPGQRREKEKGEGRKEGERRKEEGEERRKDFVLGGREGGRREGGRERGKRKKREQGG